MATDKRDIYAIMTTDLQRDTNTGHIDFIFGWMDDENKLRYFSHGELDNLEIHSQFNTPRGNDDVVENWKIYHYSTQYTSQYSVDINKAESMLFTLKKIDRGLDKISKQWGFPADYANYVLRVCKVLGVQGIIVSHNTPRSYKWNPNDYTIQDITNLSNIIANEMYRLKCGD